MRSIIVIGHARSGTSLTAGILHHLGVNMGDPSTWRPADEANEKGFFENSEFVEANQLILEDQVSPDLESIKKRHESELWGAKDPRFIKTYKEWNFTDPQFIVCCRKIDSIIKSTLHRDDGRFSPKKTKDEVLKTLVEYSKDVLALEKLRKYPVLYVDYEDYFKNEKQIREIAEFVGLPYKKTHLVDKKLKHF